MEIGHQNQVVKDFKNMFTPQNWEEHVLTYQWILVGPLDMSWISVACFPSIFVGGVAGSSWDIANQTSNKNVAILPAWSLSSLQERWILRIPNPQSQEIFLFCC